MYLSEGQIIGYLKDGVSFTFRQDGTEGELCREVSFSLGEEGAEVTLGAYQALVDGEVIFTCEGEEGFLSFIREKKIILERINGFASVEEYEEDKAFSSADMQTLLNKYADCDAFSLSGFYGEYHLSTEEGARICEELRLKNKGYLEGLYSRWAKEYALPPFEELYEEIFAECEKFGKRRKKRKWRKFFQYSFICDEVGKKTKYAQPTELFWHFYHTVGCHFDNRNEVERLSKFDEEFSAVDSLEGEYFPLKAHFLRCNISFATHCTTCGNLQKELFFALNDETRAWLARRKNDYDFEGELQDLAFYKAGKLRFSSCTHEGYHDDIK